MADEGSILVGTRSRGASNGTSTLAIVLGVVAVVVSVVTMVVFLAVSQPTLNKVKDTNNEVRDALATLNTAMPSKWAAKYLLPQYFQENRGTCWAFGTIGFLEVSYRANGVKKGFLKPEQYVRLSEQAYGLSMIEACREHPEVCDFPGDSVSHNSSTGGEMPWLWTLTSLYDKVLPEAVCPYPPEEKDEHKCDGMQEALAKNPIKFNITAMETAYSAVDTKKLMLKHQMPLAWSSTMHVVYYYYPCNDAFWASNTKCSEAEHVRCPTDRNYNSEWCAEFESPMYNMDGEFFVHGPTVSEGGHAMNVVGYNDEFVTKAGFKGGFIIKNSWHDLVYYDNPGRGARGSHSVKYWMQQISAWDEKRLCPAPLNPDNWYSCVSADAGPTMARGRRASGVSLRSGYEDIDITRTCLDKAFMDKLVKVTLQPTEFRCLDVSVCNPDPAFRYFLAEYHHNTEQDLATITMLEYNSNISAKRTVKLPYMNPSIIAFYWVPIDSQLAMLPEDRDACGYYFWPYELYKTQVAIYRDAFTNFFAITWEDMSYEANAAKYPDRDYSLVRASTGVQKEVDFGPSPYPFGNVRY